MRLEGKTVAVTGASRGLGLVIAQEAAARGAKVGLIARTAGELEAVAKELTGRGSEAASATADVASREEVEAALASIEQRLGPIDVLVANAGIGYLGDYASMDPDLVEKLFRVNVMGTLHPIRCVLPAMVARKSGHIAVVSSIAGHLGVSREAVYSATKFALNGFTEGLRAELSGSGVGVTVACPGPIKTSFFETRGVPYSGRIPRPADPRTITKRFLHAVEHDRAEIVFPRWIRIALAVKALAPPVFRAGLVASQRG